MAATSEWSTASSKLLPAGQGGAGGPPLSVCAHVALQVSGWQRVLVRRLCAVRRSGMAEQDCSVASCVAASSVGGNS
jgi:hypothetical protein